MTNKIPVYAVIRIDKYLENLPGPLEEIVTVQSVLPTLDEAKAEVARLNALRTPEKVLYFCRVTRFYPEGRGVDQSSDEE
jgi:hypothetical protein